jgi:hypothetical protein
VDRLRKTTKILNQDVQQSSHGSKLVSVDYKRTSYRYIIRLSQKDAYILASVSRPALGPTQPPVQWVPGVLSPGVKRGRGVMLTASIIRTMSPDDEGSTHL